MENSLHKHQVVEGIRAYVQITFPQLAREDISLRATPEFRNKNFRKVSFSSSLFYLLKRLQKSFPLPDYGICVAEALMAHLREQYFAEMLEREYSNNVG